MLRGVTCSWGKTQLPTTTYWVDHLRFRSRAKNPPQTLNSPNQFRERRSSHLRKLMASGSRKGTRRLFQVRRYGKKILMIEHRNYAVNAGQSTNARSTVRETAVTQTN